METRFLKKRSEQHNDISIYNKLICVIYGSTKKINVTKRTLGFLFSCSNKTIITMWSIYYFHRNNGTLFSISATLRNINTMTTLIMSMTSYGIRMAITSM